MQKLLVIAGLAVLAAVAFSPVIAATLAEPDSVNSAAIIDGQVKTTDIAAGGVTNSDIAQGAISNTKIGNSAVTNSKIAAGAISYSKLGNNTIDSSKIKDGSIAFNDLSTDVRAMHEKIYFRQNSASVGPDETARIEVHCKGDSGNWVGNPTPDYMMPDYLGIYVSSNASVSDYGVIVEDFGSRPEYATGAYIVIYGDIERSGGGATLEIMCISSPAP